MTETRAAAPFETASPADTLRAGGLVPAGAALPADEPSDAVDARAYAHAALPGRVVVRLSPASLAPGDDAEMAAMGFAAPDVTPGVARARRRAAGFPGWALLNDPGRARLALDVVREFKVQAKRARSKPGHARDGLQAIADTLARSVPHFLPSFWEEAARAFVQTGNLAYAAQCFEKARQAEREHGLKVEEAARAEAFLEFALAGALSVKSLTGHARDLSRDPAGAWDRFRELCVKRTRAGLPPWAAMPKDVRAMAKAAGRDAEAEERALLAEVTDSPALARMAFECWKSWRKSFVELARADGSLRRRLIDLFPDPAGDPDDFHGWWFDLLEDAGSLALLRGEGTGETPLPAGNAASWLARAARWSDESVRLFPILRGMASRLRADGVPLVLADPEEDSTLPLDLLDLALELGVPVADPSDDLDFSLVQWARGEGTAEEARPRDPVHVAADPRFAGKLRDAVGSAAGRDVFEKAARGKEALKDARRAWLVGLVGELSGGAIPGLRKAVETIEDDTAPAIFAEFPEALAALEAADALPAIARSLRGGILDELGWPAFESAWRALAGTGKKKSDVEVGGAFPHPVLWSEQKGIVLGPKGRVLAHDLRIPKGGEVEGCLYSGGQLLVLFRDDEYEHKAYWSGQPDAVFAPKGRLRARCVSGIVLEDGTVSIGRRAVHPGDTEIGGDGLISDGTTAWSWDRYDDERRWVEFDPRTGERGRVSLPRWIEEGGGDGWERVQGACRLLPVPVGLEGSPLGVRDGLYGLRVFRKEEPDGEDAPVRCETLDGRAWTGIAEDVPDALMRWPGDGRARPVAVDSGYWSGDDFKILDPEDGAVLADSDDDPDFARGSDRIPPFACWHYLAPRDEAGSRALRAVSDDDIRALVDAARRDLAALAESKVKADEDSLPPLPLAEAELAGRLAAVTHPALLRGLLGFLHGAAKIADRLARLVVARRAGAEAEDDGEDDEDDELRAALNLLGGGGWYGCDPSKQVRAAAAWLAGGGGAGVAPASETEWEKWLGGGIRALAYRAASPALDAGARAALVRALERWAGSRFAEVTAGLRVVRLRFDDAASPFVLLDPDDDDGEAVADHWFTGDGGSRYFARRTSDSTDRPVEVTAVESAGEGGFRLPHGAFQVSERRWDGPPEAEWVRAFLAVLAERGPAPFDPAAPDALAAAAGLSRPQATLLLAGLPRFGVYEHDFLGKEARGVLGIKVAEAATSRDSLKELLDGDAALDLLARAAPDDPAGLWSPLGAGPDDERSPVVRLARAWRERMGSQAAIPEDLLARVEKELELDLSSSEMLRAAADPDASPRFTRDGDWFVDWAGDVERRPGGAEGDVFDADAMLSFARYIAWASAALPVGDPYRSALPRLLDLARARLLAPGFLLAFGEFDVEELDGGKKRKGAFLRSLGGAEYRPGPRDPEGEAPDGRDTGLLVAVSDGDEVHLAFRPALLSSGQDRALLDRLRTDTWQDPLRPVDFLLSGDAAALAARIADTPVPAGGFEANPAASAPEVVAEVRERCTLSEDAAVLYLQTLALLQPTAKDVQRWNSWKAARYTQAAAACVAAGVLVEARRAKAGRDHFLPGGWEPAKGEMPAFESWKAPLLGIPRDEDGDLDPPLGKPYALRPLHLLFADAWARVKAGDRPGYEQSGTRLKGKGRK